MVIFQVEFKTSIFIAFVLVLIMVVTEFRFLFHKLTEIYALNITRIGFYLFIIIYYFSINALLGLA